MHAAAQFNTLQPVRDEQRALDPAQLAQGHGQSVLARVAAELAQHQRGGDGALLDRAGGRRMSSQWARTCLMFRVPPISGRNVG
nr:hypothetical protein [Klebsiella pneumoniae]CAH0654098.1 Mobilization_integration [Citrobacter youngae]